MRRSTALALLMAITLAAGCTRFATRPGRQNDEAEAGVPVVVQPAEQGTMAETLTVTGTIRAQREADVGAQISAKVLSVNVREGDLVREGDVLIALDPAQADSQVRQARAGAEAAAARLAAAEERLAILEEGAREEERAIARSRLEQAQSALRTAEADLNRLRGLFEQGAVSKQQLDAAQVAYDTARTNRDSARQSLELLQKGARPKEIEAARKDVQAAAAGLEQAQAVLSEAQERQRYTVIRSPISGVVYERHVDPGEITASGGGDPLLRLADFSSVYYEATVPERVALRVREDQRVNVTVQGNGDRRVEGKVERLVLVANPASRDFLVRIDIVDGRNLTKPGMFARGAVVVREQPGAVVIPKDALVERRGDLFAFVVEGNEARQRKVEVGITDRERAEIISGIRAGERVVLVGAQGLKDGDPVQIRDSGGS